MEFCDKVYVCYVRACPKSRRQSRLLEDRKQPHQPGKPDVLFQLVTPYLDTLNSTHPNQQEVAN